MEAILPVLQEQLPTEEFKVQIRSWLFSWLSKTDNYFNIKVSLCLGICLPLPLVCGTETDELTKNITFLVIISIFFSWLEPRLFPLKKRLCVNYIMKRLNLDYRKYELTVLHDLNKLASEINIKHRDFHFMQYKSDAVLNISKYRRMILHLLITFGMLIDPVKVAYR